MIYHILKEEYVSWDMYNITGLYLINYVCEKNENTFDTRWYFRENSKVPESCFMVETEKKKHFAHLRVTEIVNGMSSEKKIK